MNGQGLPYESRNGNASFAAMGTIQSVPPALFSISGDAGESPPMRSRCRPPTHNFDHRFLFFNVRHRGCVPTPIQLTASASVHLILDGTGIRHRSSLANVTANIRGTGVPMLYDGVQPSFDGLDQVKFRLPRSLSESGEVNIVLTLNGQTANVVAVNIQ